MPLEFSLQLPAGAYASLFARGTTTHTVFGGCRLHFLKEFMEVGGALTVLEILSLPQVSQTDKTAALRLLTHVAMGGRKFKEMLCESYAVKYVASCLASSHAEHTQAAARNLLQELGMGNPPHLPDVIRKLVMLLPTAHPGAQQMAAQALRLMVPMAGSADVTVIEPVLSLLSSMELQVQYEACELIKVLVTYDNVVQSVWLVS